MIRKISISLLVFLTVLFGYANLRHVNPSAYLEPVDVMTLEFTNVSGTSLGKYGSWAKSSPYIHACSLDESGRTIGVTYEFKNMSKEQLLEHLSYEGKIAGNQKDFSASNKPGCPVHDALAAWEKSISAVRVVH